MNKPLSAARRGFIGVAASALAGVMIAPGIRLIQIAQAAPDAGAAGAAGVAAPRSGARAAVRWGMLVDINRCAPGCNACVSACATENGLSAASRPTDPQWIRKIEIKDLKTGHSQSLPMMCQHCAEPPCVDVCPTGASFKRADGIVLVDRHSCIGCRYCVMACPYQARSFVHEDVTDQKADVPRGKGCVEGCTMCVHRVDAGRSPACVEACAAAEHGAMLFGDLNDPASEIAIAVARHSARQVREDLNLDTGVRYLGL
jgi:molybdopterin-containing oxidoreductase family iron-sulfur binding subunit